MSDEFQMFANAKRIVVERPTCHRLGKVASIFVVVVAAGGRSGAGSAYGSAGHIGRQLGGRQIKRCIGQL